MKKDTNPRANNNNNQPSQSPEAKQGRLRDENLSFNQLCDELKAVVNLLSFTETLSQEKPKNTEKNTILEIEEYVSKLSLNHIKKLYVKNKTILSTIVNLEGFEFLSKILYSTSKENEKAERYSSYLLGTIKGKLEVLKTKLGPAKERDLELSYDELEKEIKEAKNLLEKYSKDINFNKKTLEKISILDGFCFLDVSLLKTDNRGNSRKDDYINQLRKAIQKKEDLLAQTLQFKNSFERYAKTLNQIEMLPKKLYDAKKERPMIQRELDALLSKISSLCEQNLDDKKFSEMTFNLIGVVSSLPEEKNKNNAIVKTKSILDELKKHISNLEVNNNSQHANQQADSNTEKNSDVKNFYTTDFKDYISEQINLIEKLFYLIGENLLKNKTLSTHQIEKYNKYIAQLIKEFENQSAALIEEIEKGRGQQEPFNLKETKQFLNDIQSCSIKDIQKKHNDFFGNFDLYQPDNNIQNNILTLESNLALLFSKAKKEELCREINLMLFPKNLAENSLKKIKNRASSNVQENKFLSELEKKFIVIQEVIDFYLVYRNAAVEFNFIPENLIKDSQIELTNSINSFNETLANCKKEQDRIELEEAREKALETLNKSLLKINTALNPKKHPDDFNYESSDTSKKWNTVLLEHKKNLLKEMVKIKKQLKFSKEELDNNDEIRSENIIIIPENPVKTEVKSENYNISSDIDNEEIKDETSIAEDLTAQVERLVKPVKKSISSYLFSLENDKLNHIRTRTKEQLKFANQYLEKIESDQAELDSEVVKTQNKYVQSVETCIMDLQNFSANLSKINEPKNLSESIKLIANLKEKYNALIINFFNSSVQYSEHRDSILDNEEETKYYVAQFEALNNDLASFIESVKASLIRINLNEAQRAQKHSKFVRNNNVYNIEKNLKELENLKSGILYTLSQLNSFRTNSSILSEFLSNQEFQFKNLSKACLNLITQYETQKELIFKEEEAQDQLESKKNEAEKKFQDEINEVQEFKNEVVTSLTPYISFFKSIPARENSLERRAITEANKKFQCLINSLDEILSPDYSKYGLNRMQGFQAAKEQLPQLKKTMEEAAQDLLSLLLTETNLLKESVDKLKPTNNDDNFDATIDRLNSKIETILNPDIRDKLPTKQIIQAFNDLKTGCDSLNASPKSPAPLISRSSSNSKLSRTTPNLLHNPGSMGLLPPQRTQSDKAPINVVSKNNNNWSSPSLRKEN